MDQNPVSRIKAILVEGPRSPIEHPDEFWEIPAIDLVTLKPCALYIWKDRMEAERAKGRRSQRELADTVRFSVLFPRSGFRGLRRVKGGDKRLCYAARPDFRYRGDESSPQKVPNSGEVFLVFVSEYGVIYAWGWEPCDPKDSNSPLDEPDQNGMLRFDERIL